MFFVSSSRYDPINCAVINIKNLGYPIVGNSLTMKIHDSFYVDLSKLGIRMIFSFRRVLYCAYGYVCFMLIRSLFPKIRFSNLALVFLCKLSSCKLAGNPLDNFKSMISSFHWTTSIKRNIELWVHGVKVVLLSLQKKIRVAKFNNMKIKRIGTIKIERILKVVIFMTPTLKKFEVRFFSSGQTRCGANILTSVGFAENFVDPANAFLGWVCARITHALAVPFSLRAVGCFRTVNGNLISSPIIPNFNVRNLRRNWLPAAENEGDGPSSGRSLQGTL